MFLLDLRIKMIIVHKNHRNRKLIQILNNRTNHRIVKKKKIKKKRRKGKKKRENIEVIQIKIS